MVDEYHEYSTRDENGNLISDEEAKVKYAKLLKKRQDKFVTNAAKFGFAQLVVSGVCVALAMSSNSSDIPLFVNGASMAFLFTSAFVNGKKAVAYKKIIEKIDNGEIDAMKYLQDLEVRYSKREESKQR